MLQKIVLQCTYEGDQRASYNWGSLFHGFLIQTLPPQAADNRLTSMFAEPMG